MASAPLARAKPVAVPVSYEADTWKANQGATYWLTGLSGAGKSTLSEAEVQWSLAEKKSAAKTEESSNYAYAIGGATFGVLALFTVVGVAASRKKTDDDYQQPLL